MTETKKTNGRGRPPKNVVRGQKENSSGRGRPPKNVIKPRKSQNKKTTEKKPSTKKTTTPKKTTARRKSPLIKRDLEGFAKNHTNDKKNKAQSNSQGFSSHKVHQEQNEKGSNFALRLLIASVLLFLFSIYKAFFQTPNEGPTKIVDTDILNSGTYQLTTIYEQESGSLVQTGLINIALNTSGTENSDNTNTIEIDIENTNTTGNNTENNIETNEDILADEDDTIIEISSLFSFDEAFELNQTDPDIEVLQQLLKIEDCYNGSINGIYDLKTMEAVYQFQLKHGILTENSDKRLKGFFGPGTREQANKIIQNQ